MNKSHVMLAIVACIENIINNSQSMNLQLMILHLNQLELEQKKEKRK